MDYLPEECLTPLLGKHINVDLFSRVLWHNGEGEIPDCEEYYCAEVDFLTDGPLCEAAGITEKLKDYWYTHGINYHVYFYLADGVLRHAGVFKFEEDCWALRADITELSPTKQEFRVARRMLQYFIDQSANK